MRIAQAKIGDVSHMDCDVSHMDCDVSHMDCDVSHMDCDVSHMDCDVIHMGDVMIVTSPIWEPHGSHMGDVIKRDSR